MKLKEVTYKGVDFVFEFKKRRKTITIIAVPYGCFNKVVLCRGLQDLQTAEADFFIFKDDYIEKLKNKGGFEFLKKF